MGVAPSMGAIVIGAALCIDSTTSSPWCPEPSRMRSPGPMGAPGFTGSSAAPSAYGSDAQLRLSIRSASTTSCSVRQGRAALPSPSGLPEAGST